MVIDFLTNQIRITTDTLGDLQVYHNCEFSQEFTVTESPQTFDYPLSSGIYQFTLETVSGNTTIVDTYFTDDDKCKIAEAFCNKDTYYYYTALDLLQYCPSAYEKACDIFSELNKIINDECKCL